MLFQLVDFILKNELGQYLSNTREYVNKNPDRSHFFASDLKFLEDHYKKINNMCSNDLGYKKQIETFFEQYDQYNVAHNNSLHNGVIDDVRNMFRATILEHQKQMDQLEQLREENRKLNSSIAFIAESNLQKFVEQMQTVTSQAHAAARQATEVLKGAKQGVSSPAYSSLFPTVDSNTTAVNTGVVSTATTAAMDTTTPTLSIPSRFNN